MKKVHTTMRQMVAGKLDPVEEFKRALRHAAHVYSAEPNGIGAVPERAKVEKADALYRAARALVAAELIHGAK